MLEDLKESLGLSTSQEISDVFNFEVGPVYEHVLEVCKSNFDLKNIEGIYNDELRAREKLAVHWASKSDVLGSATGIEIDKDVSETVAGMAYGDKLGGLRAPIDSKAILHQVEVLRRDTADDSVEAPQLETVVAEVAKDVEDSDFTYDQQQKARLIEAQKSIASVYSDQQIAA